MTIRPLTLLFVIATSVMAMMNCSDPAANSGFAPKEDDTEGCLEEFSNLFSQVSVGYGRVVADASVASSDASLLADVDVGDASDAGDAAAPIPEATEQPVHLLVTIGPSGDGVFATSQISIANALPSSHAVTLVEATPSSLITTATFVLSSLDVAIDLAKDASSFDLLIEKTTFASALCHTTAPDEVLDLTLHIVLDADRHVATMTSSIESGPPTTVDFLPPH